MNMASDKQASTYRLDGHKLLLLAGFPIQQAWIDGLKDKYAGLEIKWLVWDWLRKKGLPPAISDEEWKEVTILITGYDYPEPEAVPNLKLIQLVTAGSNYIVDQRSK
jgi:hypothetical protein